MNATQTTTGTTTRAPKARGPRSAAARAAAQALNNGQPGEGQQDAQDEPQAAPELQITELLHASGALFNIDPERIAEMKNKALRAGADPENLPNFPLMSGSIQDAEGVTIPVSMFREVSGEGVIYASLSLGGKGRTKFYGKLFRSKDDSGPHYSGFIIVLPVDGQDQHDEEAWEKAPRLQVCGWRRRSANGQARISLAIAPRMVADNELPL